MQMICISTSGVRVAYLTPLLQRDKVYSRAEGIRDALISKGELRREARVDYECVATFMSRLDGGGTW